MRISRKGYIGLAILGLLVVGNIVPLFIQNNLSSFKGDEHLFARYALFDASHGWGMDGAFATKMRVQSVTELRSGDKWYNPDTISRCSRVYLDGGEVPTPIDKPYQADVVGYGWFGIPVVGRHILCDGQAWTTFGLFGVPVDW